MQVGAGRGGRRTLPEAEKDSPSPLVRVAGDRESYRYLVESIRRFPDQRRFAGMIGQADFGQVDWTNFTGGVAALHTARAI